MLRSDNKSDWTLSCNAQAELHSIIYIYAVADGPAQPNVCAAQHRISGVGGSEHTQGRWQQVFTGSLFLCEMLQHRAPKPDGCMG